ncbi:MAG: glutamine synthetase type III, partial [Chitinophagales bacterium]
ALDYKAPLLKSLHLLDQAAVPVCQYFDKNVSRVSATLGWEQEYFVVDEALFLNRPDLSICGRTLIGHYPAKGQQLEDHYFGTIPERIFNFMIDFEMESHKLGIPLRTRHNEVAPGQFECAPMFEEASLAVDHNLLLMDVMEKVARHHKLRVLFHEKPFAGVNGSGKHNNWSMSTDGGKNLLSPGKTPRTNLQFLTFFINTIKAVHENSDLLRASIASANNDHRLGANEAPPAIISAFIGTALRSVLDEIENRVDQKFDDLDKADLRLDIHNKIPDLMLDNTDRNRTSPFAFTGNKFEFRAVGSSANCSKAMTTLNIIVADQLIKFREEIDGLVKGGENKDNAILKVLRRYISESKNILFEGDNYSEEWAKEATEKRGLNNVKTTPEAIDFYATEKTKNIFIKNKILTERELHARQEIEFEEYAKKIQIEARIYGELVYNYVLPAAVEYQNELLDNVLKLKAVGLNEDHYKEQIDLATTITLHLNHLRTALERMVEERKRSNRIDDAREKAFSYCNKVKPLFDEIREHADMLERYLPDSKWPLAKYRELLFVK